MVYDCVYIVTYKYQQMNRVLIRKEVLIIPQTRLYRAFAIIPMHTHSVTASIWPWATLNLVISESRLAIK